MLVYSRCPPPAHTSAPKASPCPGTGLGFGMGRAPQLAALSAPSAPSLGPICWSINIHELCGSIQGWERSGDPPQPRTPDMQSPSRGLEQGHHPRHAPAAPLLPFPAAVLGTAPFPRSLPSLPGSRMGNSGGTPGERSQFPAKWNLSTGSRRHEEAPGTTRTCLSGGLGLRERQDRPGCCPQGLGCPWPRWCPTEPG